MTNPHYLSCLVFCVSASAACSFQPPADPAPEFPQEVVEQAPVEPPPPMVFWNKVVNAELLPHAEYAIDRWIDASCLDIRIGDTGVEWTLVPEVLDDDGKPRMGVTGPNRIHPEYVRVSSAYNYKDRTSTHELGHRLGLDHVDEGGPNLMSSRNTVEKDAENHIILRYEQISEAALMELCTMRDCGCFNPEPTPVVDPADLP